MLEALIFDVDGTVAETEDLHRRAFNLAFDLHEVELAWDAREYRRLLRVHGGKERIARGLAELGVHLPPETLAQLHASKTRFYTMLLASRRAPWRPGVRRLMDEALQAGMRLALATTTSQANLEPLFAPVLGAGWRSRFGAIVAGDMVPRKKPDPGVYAEALKRLQVPAGRAVAFEDSAAGVRAARSAGLAVVATPSEWLAGDDLEDAELVLDHLGELTAADLARWHGQREAACSPRA